MGVFKPFVKPALIQPSPPKHFWQALWALVTHKKFLRRAAVWLTLVSVVVGLSTFAFIALRVPIIGGDTTIKILLNLSLACLVALTVIITSHLLRLRKHHAATHKTRGGASLYLRMARVFGLLAVTPTVIVALFAGIFFYLGVQSWFSEKVQRVVDESHVVAEAYLQEHQQAVRADTLAMINAINRAAPLLTNHSDFNRFINAQAEARSFTQALVFDASHNILARSALSFSLEFEPISEAMLDRARAGDVVLVMRKGDNNVRALAKIDGLLNEAYLFVGREVEPQVLQHVQTAAGAVQDYASIKARSGELQRRLLLTFVVVALLLLLVAVWYGLNFANRLGRPLAVMVDMAERVRAGDLTARIQEKFLHYEDELGSLGRAFNRMTGQLESQRAELVDANQQLDARRRFTEAVLAGVSAGVIGVDHDGRVTLLNASAASLLGLADGAIWIGTPLLGLIPQMAPLMAEIADKPPQRFVEGEIERHAANQLSKTFFVRVSLEQVDHAIYGYVVTFDDVSQLIAAQRKAAWGDVARRIAHEIKNPLTPIQLAAERLRRRYLKEITSDPQVFVACLDTIIRQVGDIGHMVDEFSAFARMPKAVLQCSNLNDICHEAVLLQATSHPDMAIQAELPLQPLMAVCDARLIRQSITNVMKNAIEAIEAVEGGEAGQAVPHGMVQLTLEKEGAQEAGFVVIRVDDNGKGLPKTDRHRLTEPYVTTRAKGTGLGLAIVKKIMEDHQGTLQLSDREGGGTRVELRFPLVEG